MKKQLQRHTYNGDQHRYYPFENINFNFSLFSLEVLFYRFNFSFCRIVRFASCTFGKIIISKFKNEINDCFGLSLCEAGFYKLFKMFVCIKKRHSCFHISTVNILRIECLSILIIFIITAESQAFKFTNEICEEYGLGKSWYCETEQSEKTSEVNANEILNSPLSPEAKAVALNELWERQRKIAVITGKREDLENFLTTQYIIAEKGVDFARKLQRITETNARFSDNQSYYKNLQDQYIKEAEDNEILNTSNKRYALVFIYDSTCPYCQRQYPIIQSFKKEYNFKVLGISADGNHFDGLDEKLTDSEIASHSFVAAFPTIILLDKEKPSKTFISKGLITLDELKERIINRIREVSDAKGN